MLRTDIINALIARSATRYYLEIGLRNAADNFDKVNAFYAMSVDPATSANAKFKMTSDEYFAQNAARPQPDMFDVIFIDGMHTGRQVYKDIMNAVKCLNKDGFIVLHDMIPKYWKNATEYPCPGESAWNGTCWKALVALRTDADFCSKYDIQVIEEDWGCGVIRRGSTPVTTIPVADLITMSFEDSLPVRRELLRITSFDRYMETLP